MTARALATALAPCVIVWLLGGCASTGTKDSASPSAEESPADLYVSMASAYFQRGQIDAAYDRARQAIAEDDKSAAAHYMLALVHQQLGQVQEADREFDEAVRLDPQNPMFRNAWGTVLCRQKRYQEAIGQFKQAVDKPLYKTPEIALTNAADCSLRAGKDTQAETFLREALTHNPAYGPALLAMAQRSYKVGAYQEARDYMARYSRVGQATPAALLLAARIEQRLGNTKNAKALETSLRRRFPDSPEIMQL